MKNIFLNIIVLLFSVFIALVTVEFLVRVSVNPVNYLKPKLESDPILGHKIVADSGGHDSWGFRNNTVPKKVDILAIGDSQTYGVMAPANKSWPAALAKLTNKNVYNLSLGGYGPVQYLHLLKTKSKILSPKLVIVGVYLGNDFIDSYRQVYSNDYWRDFRLNKFKLEENNTIIVNEGKSIRQWLAYNSVIYRMITNSFIGDIIRLREAKSLKPINSNFFVNLGTPDIDIGFTPAARLTGLDLNDMKVQEGLRISLAALNEINSYTKKNEMELLVVIIPTKENVYAEVTKINQPAYNKLIDNESKVTQLLVNFLNNNKINYLEPLVAMREAAVNKAIYPAGYDGHPNKDGYYIIADEIRNNIIN